MKRLVGACLAAAVGGALLASLAIAAGKTYQVTGPVVDVKDNLIVVQKGNDKWELERDANTKVTGDLKVGERVTIEYRMVATSIAVKGGAATAKPKKEKK